MEHLSVVREFEDGKVIQVSPESQSGTCPHGVFFSLSLPLTKPPLNPQLRNWLSSISSVFSREMFIQGPN